MFTKGFELRPTKPIRNTKRYTNPQEKN